MSDKKNNVILEEYENEFLYKKSKTNLNIEFNRIAFIFLYIFSNLHNLFNTTSSFRLTKSRKIRLSL